jgi:cyclophilin family peptidyl-prolyl cis-trans isomerase/HEAT repeat protein
MVQRAGAFAIAAALTLSLQAQRPQQSQSRTDARRLAILAAEDTRATTIDDVSALLDLARSQDVVYQAAAVRALGRLERRDVITDLLGFLSARSNEVRAEAANALAQALRGEPLAGVPAGQQETAVREALLQAGSANYDNKVVAPLNAIARALGRLPYDRAEALRASEQFLRRVLERATATGGESAHAAAARGLESLARLNRRLPQPFEEETQTRLRALATSLSGPADPRRNALAALVASQGADNETLRTVVNDPDPEVRRQAVLALIGTGALISPDERLDRIRDFLADRSFMVRYEAVRAWARRAPRDQGCQPLLEALTDESLHVVLVAMDALADSCPGDAAITDRLTSESRTPPPQGNWQREAHAFVALAKRAPDRAQIALPTFATHIRWPVRMYAARAAASMNDVPWLTRLAADPDDNVAETALPALRKRVGAESDSAFIAALGRKPHPAGLSSGARPYQVIRTAALELKGAQSTPQLVTALSEALQRITAEQCDTSRDVRMTLIERLSEMGSVAQVRTLTPLLKDGDPEIARVAAALIGRWTGTVPEIEPVRRTVLLPNDDELSPTQTATIEMASGRRFSMAFHMDQAPLSATRFIRLVKGHYYDGTTFHRVVPNFVIQGGSPNANEYCGDCPFMRDERGLLMHVRGSVGISTRGRDTGDAQIFINLVDNARLDHDYSVFARVCGRDMEVVDGILEADQIRRITIGSDQRCF